MKYYGIIFLLFAFIFATFYNPRIKIFKDISDKYLERQLIKSESDRNFLYDRRKASRDDIFNLDGLIKIQSEIDNTGLYDENQKLNLHLILDSIGIDHYDFQSNQSMLHSIISNRIIFPNVMKQTPTIYINKIEIFNDNKLKIGIELFNDFKESSNLVFYDKDEKVKLVELYSYKRPFSDLSVVSTDPRCGIYKTIYPK